MPYLLSEGSETMHMTSEMLVTLQTHAPIISALVNEGLGYGVNLAYGQVVKGAITPHMGPYKRDRRWPLVVQRGQRGCKWELLDDQKRL